MPARLFTPVEEAKLRLLTAASSDVAYLFLTETGLEKSIMDATAPVRELLLLRGIHDYGAQGQGEESKALRQCTYHGADGAVGTQVSLYRPQTKLGDPRIWVYGLRNDAQPGDVLVLLISGGDLHVFNLRSVSEGSLRSGQTADLLRAIRHDTSQAADELIRAIRTIAQRGLIPARGTGDTAIGRTLESELGISMNSSKAPDYKGIELKSYRTQRANRKTLFAQVPDWDVSRLKSSAALLNLLGYERGGVKKYYNTVSCAAFNSQDVALRLEDARGQLVEYSKDPLVGDVVAWRLSSLHSRLAEKHRETFWVAADSADSGDGEMFQFTRIEHTRRPVPAEFDRLLAVGAVTVDHLIKAAGSSAHERGPLFKVTAQGWRALFPEVEVIDLI